MTAPVLHIHDVFDLFDALAAAPAPYPPDLLAKRRAVYISAMHELGAGDHEPEFADAWCWDGYDYLGTRCIISGGEVLELDSRRISADEPSDEEMPF